MRRLAPFLLLLAAPSFAQLAEDPLPPGCVRRLGTTRFKHPGGLDCLAVSPDGSLIASGGYGSIALFEASSGRRLWLAEDLTRRLDGLQGMEDFPERFLAIAFVEGDRILAIAETAQVWLLDRATGLERSAHRLRGGPESIAAYQTALAGDGRRIAIGYEEEPCVRLWRTLDGVLEREIAAAETPCSPALSARGGHLAFVEAGTIRVFDLLTGDPIATHPVGASDVVFSSDGEVLGVVLGGEQPIVAVLETLTGKERWRAMAEEYLLGIRFGGGDRTLLGGPTSLLGWDARTGDRLPLDFDPQTGDPVGPWALAAFPGSTRVVVGDGCTIQTIDPLAPSVPVEPTSPIYGVAVGPSGRFLAASGNAGTFLWDLAADSPGALRVGDGGTVRYSPDGRLAIASSDLILVDPRDVRGAVRLPVSACGASLAFSGDGRRVAAADERDGTVVLDLPSGRSIPGEWARSRHSVDLDRATDRVATGDRGRIELWDLRSGTRTGLLAHEERVPYGCVGLVGGGDVVWVRFLPFRDGLLAAYQDDTLRYWSIATGRQGWRLPCPWWGHPRAALSRDGRLVAVAGSDDLRLHDVLTGELVRQWGAGLEVESLDFGPGARTLATGMSDATVLIWDLVGEVEPPEGLGPLWQGLSGPAPEADREHWRLVAGGDRAVEFLARAVEATRPAPGRLESLLADLDHADPAAREAAHRELESLGSSIAEPLRERAGGLPEESRHRVFQLLGRLEETLAPWDLAWQRALFILEAIDTPAAQALLQGIADRSPSPRIRRAARGVLERRR